MAAFENLGGDALLVVPQCFSTAGERTTGQQQAAPLAAPCDGWQPAEGSPYAHIADFMRRAPLSQVIESESQHTHLFILLFHPSLDRDN